MSRSDLLKDAVANLRKGGLLRPPDCAHGILYLVEMMGGQTAAAQEVGCNQATISRWHKQARRTTPERAVFHGE